jgi:hypothetical protein
MQSINIAFILYLKCKHYNFVSAICRHIEADTET